MAQISEKILQAIDSDCADSLSQIIKEKRQEDFEALQEFLSPEALVKPEYRTRALYALGRWGNPTVVEGIHRLLPTLDEAGRISAVDALGRLGTEEALTDILDCVNDSSPQVRKFAVHALRKINTSTARAKLQEVATQESIDYIREQATKYLESN